jgi:putative ABC transport system permease protein
MACTGVIVKQTNFVQSAKLGFDQEQIIVIPDVYEHINYEALRQRLLQHPEVVNVASSSGMISGNNWHGKMLTRHSNNEIPMTLCNIDTSFLQTLGITMLQNMKMSTSDSVRGLVINEAAARQLGLSSPVGEEILWPRDDRPLKIIGVVKDFHFESLHERISPLVLQITDQFLSNVFVRVKPVDLNDLIGKIKSEWKNVAPDRPFQYFFLDSQIEAQYQAEMKFKTFFLLTTIVAMLIACFGLIGLTALIVRNRTKEIGIRKLLGASPLSIIRLLTNKMLLIILVSIAIALPIAYLAMENWLRNFAYHIILTANAWIFILPSIIVICLAFLTTGLLSLRTVNTNPVKMLRSE